jgi:hypothetical protein
MNFERESRRKRRMWIVAEYRIVRRMTYAEIGRHLGCSRQRVHQIYNEYRYSTPQPTRRSNYDLEHHTKDGKGCGDNNRKVRRCPCTERTDSRRKIIIGCSGSDPKCNASEPEKMNK